MASPLSAVGSTRRIRWHLGPELAPYWPADEAWPLDGWRSAGLARVVKQGPHRTIYRVDLPGLSFFVKRHHLPDRTTWLRQCLRPAKARREFDALEGLRLRGIPAPALLHEAPPSVLRNNPCEVPAYTVAGFS